MKIKSYILLLLATSLFMSSVKAQLAPLGAMYYHNQYLNNPAFAGKDAGLTLDLGIRQQWSNVPGAPKVQVLTGAYAITQRAGLGLNVHNDQTGLFKTTRIMGSYAYHLPLSANANKLSFGLSLGLMDQLIDYSLLDGNIEDPSLRNFNQRQQYLDGDFGLAYTSATLNVQGSVPNLRNNLGFSDNGDQVVNEARFFAAASYKLLLSETEGMAIEPKIAYRAIRGTDDIVDIGANFTFVDQKIGLIAIYHTSKSASFGFNGKVSKAFNVTGFYTSNTAALAGRTNGSFELNLKLNLFNK